MASEYLKRLAQRSRERREEDENVVRSVTRVSKKSAPKPTAPAPSITRQYQTIQSENERQLTDRERENNRLYSAYESEIGDRLSKAAVKNPLVASEIFRADERQRKESAQRMGETAAVTSYLRSEQSKIPYTQVSDAGKLVKTGDTVKVIKPGEENLYQGDAPALGGPVESGSETVRKRYAESIRPFFENEDYISDGNLLFEKYGEDAIPLIENALADWKENKRLHPERVQAGAELTEQANNFEKQLRWTLAALKEIQYTAKRENEDFSKLAAQGAQMDSPAATARERLTSDNKFTAGVGLMLGDHRYAVMTEEERQLYNYLLAKEGEQSAQGYLKTIEDRLNARFGKTFHDTAENLENPLQRAGVTAVTSVGAGLHDFGTGVHQSFTDEPVARAPLQYAADLYSSELGGVSKFAFDTGRTIGNMAPSIAASAALGGLGAPAAAAGAVSSAMTGLSSAGNSYREAIKQGYLPEEARQYATMSGLSEFGTTYLLSGISKFGGKLTGDAAKAASDRVTNGALRFALDTGIKMGGEGIEEVLQNELDLFFRNMVLGEDNDLNPLTEENAYTFLMAAATAGLLEGPSSAVNAWNSSQLTQAGRAVEESGNLNTLLNRSLAGSPELRDTAGRVLYGEGTERLMAAGELLLRYAEETGDAGLILRTPERNEELSLPRQEAVFRDESRQKYGTKTGEHFRMLPVFKNGKVVEGYWDAAKPVKVGRGTVIQRPYTGENTPKNIDVQQKNAPVVIDSGTVEKAAAEITKARESGQSVRGTIRRVFGQVFDSMGGARKVRVDGVNFENAPYDVTLNKNLVGKVISDPHLSPEKLSVLYQLDDAVRGAEYVGSGEYNKNKSKAQNVIRYDYFENEVEIGDEPYLMTFDVEVYHGTNNMRTYRTIKEIDLTPVEGNVTPSKADAATHGSRTRGLTPGRSSLFSDTNISQSETGVNTQSMQGAGEISASASSGAARGKALYPIFDKNRNVINGYGMEVDTANRGGYSDTRGGGRNGQGLGNRSAAGRSDAGHLYQESGGGRGTETESHTGGGAGVSGVPEKNTGNLGQIQNTGEAREVRISYPDSEVSYHSPALSDTAETTRALAQRFAERGLNAEIFDGDMAELRGEQRIVHHGRAMTLSDGTVVLRNGTENADEVLQHELIHHGARMGTPEANRVIAAVQESGLNVNDRLGWDNLQTLTKRYERNGKRLADLGNEGRLFEELSATIAGFHRRDPEGTRRAFGGLFNDYDGIISAIEEAYPELNTRGSGETPAAFSSARNMEDSSGAFGEDSVGAARPLSTEEKAQPYDNYVREYGAIPKGENPVRDVDVPRKTGKNRHTRQGARTFIESAHTPEAMVQELKDAVADNLFAYERSGNKEMQNQADATLHNEGFDGALEKWDAVYERGIAKPGELVLGETLYIEAARRGEKQLAIELAAEVSELATEAGRSVQVMRIMSKATPEGKLYSLENSVRKINGRLKERYKRKFKRGKMQEVSIPNELKEKLLSAKTSEQADAILSEIERHIAEQLPSTIGDRVDAWRYFAMLSNPRTHIRNFFGNVVFGRVVDAKDLVGAALEKAFLPQDERSKAVLTPKDKALRAFAAEDFETVRGEIMGTGKMNPQGRIEAQKKAFKHETLNRITGAPGNLLEWADEKALRPRYAKALAGFLKARGITAETIHTEKGKKALAAGRQYAITEAQKATFRDTSRVANELSRWEKKNVFTRVLIGGTLPFKKTPVNVLKRGVEYSPAGLIKGTADLLTKVREGRMSASQAIDEISAGTVGTGLAILGYWLGSMGIVSLGGSDDEKERGFESLQGKQNYALNIGGHSYTIDWLSPAAMPFFVGAEFQKLLEEGSDLAPKDMLEAVSKILDPVLEMSFMDGVQDSLESAAYGEFGGPFANLAVSPFVNYPSQFIPSVLGGVARTVDPVRRSYYADKNNNVFTNSMQKSFQKAVAKIPYFSQTLEPYVDQWGREEVNDSVFGRLLENFVSPGYYSKETVTEVDEEIERLYAQTGEKTVLPAYAPDDVTQDNKKYNMTAKEHTQHAKTKGQTAFRTIEALLDTPDYKEADDAEKVKFIRDVYDYSGQVAKKELLAGRKVVFEPDRWVSEAHAKAGNQKGGRQVAQAIAFRRTLAEVDLTVESYDKVRTAQRKMGISYQDYVDVYADVAAARKKYEDSDEKPDKIREAIYGSTKLNADQKAYMSFLFVRGDVEDADALKTLGGISYSVYEDYLNEASKITAKDENGNTVNGLAKRRKEWYIDSLPINDSQKELLKATISTSKASRSYLKYRIEVAPLTREQKSELWEHFLGD